MHQVSPPDCNMVTHVVGRLYNIGAKHAARNQSLFCKVIKARAPALAAQSSCGEAGATCLVPNCKVCATAADVEGSQHRYKYESLGWYIALVHVWDPCIARDSTKLSQPSHLPGGQTKLSPPSRPPGGPFMLTFIGLVWLVECVLSL